MQKASRKFPGSPIATIANAKTSANITNTFKQ
jgi:hypothetical protein